MADSRPATIRFCCGHCRALLKTPADKAHTTVRCPKCHQPTLVPAESLGPEPIRPDLEDGPYQIWPVGTQPPADDPTAHRRYIPVLCKLCQTRMYATEQQVGQAIVCPDCGTENVVPAPLEPRPRKTRPLLPDSAEPLELEDPIDRPPFELLGDPGPGHPGPTQTVNDPSSAPAEPDAEQLYPQPGEPRWPFWSGIFGFWLRPGTRARWFALSALGAAVFWLATTAVELGATFSALTLTSSMFFSGVACLVGLIWLVAMSAHALAIVHDTSYGYDAIVTWPGSVWLDWALEVIYVVNSLAISGLVAAAIVKLLQVLGQPAPLVVPATIFLLFPVVLLSMLEAGSCLVPITWPIARTMLVLVWAWSLFYIEAAVVAATAGGPAWFAFHTRNAPLAACTAPLVVAGLIVYFRLLGRLAWVCSTKLTDEAEEEPPGDEAG